VMISKKARVPGAAVAVLIALAGIAPARAVDLDGTSVPGEKLLVYLLVGNSALTGRDYDKDTVVDPRCWNYVLYDCDEQFSWQPAREPIYADKNNHGEKGGPTLPFLKSLAAELGDEYYCASLQISGSAFTVADRFLPGNDEYDLLIGKALALKDEVTLAGIISMLGLVEVEEGGTHVTDFLDNIEMMVGRMREDLAVPELPYIHSGYPREAGGRYAVTTTGTIQILEQEAQITERISNAAVVPTEGLTILEDSYLSHYDRGGCIAWGERVVEVLTENEWLPGEVSVRLQGSPDRFRLHPAGGKTLVVRRSAVPALSLHEHGRLGVFTPDGRRQVTTGRGSGAGRSGVYVGKPKNFTTGTEGL